MAQVYGEAIVGHHTRMFEGRFRRGDNGKGWRGTGQGGGGRSHFQRECVIPVMTWRRRVRLRCVGSLVVGTSEAVSDAVISVESIMVDSVVGSSRWLRAC